MGDYVPVTPLGKTIASFMMFAAIVFLWTFIRLLGNMIITRRVKKQKTRRRRKYNGDQVLVQQNPIKNHSFFNHRVVHFLLASEKRPFPLVHIA